MPHSTMQPLVSRQDFLIPGFTILQTCLVAASRAQYLGYPYGAYPYAAAVPFGSSTGLDPITQGLDPVTQGVAIPAAHYIGKRSADADAEADADAYYGYPYAYAGVPFGSSTGLDPITQGLDPVTQGVAVPAHYGYGYAAYPYAAYGAYPYAAYSGAYYGWGK